MAEVIIYSTTVCPYCVRAKQLLVRKGLAYKGINLCNKAPERRMELVKPFHKFLLMTNSLADLTNFML